ncbi:hypothetical protein EV401DRAFT_629381 [Pisolithus croceorrhizus]|nr:hypothetical protein EV401DRAFT_629381 [Pisolithus croceorrhizus]
MSQLQTMCLLVLAIPFRRGVPVRHPALYESKANEGPQGLTSNWDAHANRLAQGYDKKTVTLRHILVERPNRTQSNVQSARLHHRRTFRIPIDPTVRCPT